jgi:hypothetical protein
MLLLARSSLYIVSTGSRRSKKNQDSRQECGLLRLRLRGDDFVFFLVKEWRDDISWSREGQTYTHTTLSKAMQRETCNGVRTELWKKKTVHGTDVLLRNLDGAVQCTVILPISSNFVSETC